MNARTNEETLGELHGQTVRSCQPPLNPLDQNLRQRIQEPINLVLGDDERRDKPQYSFHRAVDQEPTGQTVVHDRFPLDRELHALQQTKTAHVLDDLETVLKVKQTLGQIIAHAAAPLQPP